MTASLFAAPAGAIARVALPVPGDDPFDYAVPAPLASRLQVGARVRVRFQSRALVGVVVDLPAQSAYSGALRPIEELLDESPALSVELLGVLREAAEKALCPLGIALAAALPAGSIAPMRRALDCTPRGRAALASGLVAEPARTLLAALGEGPRSTEQLARRGVDLGSLGVLRADGLVQEISVAGRASAQVASERVARVAAGIDAEQARSALARAPRQAALFTALAARGETALRALTAETPGADRLLRELAQRGLVEIARRATPRDVLGHALAGETPVELTPDQQHAFEPIVEAVQQRRAERFLLHGVTGSGKTEIYLRAVGATLRAGRQALVLVPEITLTHQILARLRSRFGDDMAVLHSGLRPGERLEQWNRLREGRTPIAVGARSALFAPLERLGLIVMDEEHDSAYKNEEGFRYHARDLATLRARAAQCPLILGSATPALETRHAADRGELRRLVLPSRIGGRPLPAVELVDLQAERNLTAGRRPILSRCLHRALRETLEAGAQSILMLNRRGFSSQIFCFDCGHAERCPNCDIALTFHTSGHQLLCHYCDYSLAPPEQCSRCGAPDTALLGLGTERIEEEVRQRFPAARLARLDRDTAARRGHTEQVLHRLQRGEVDIVIGTQMVAKGHDFPGVRLVGVVLADIGLHLPDFRAAERSFQLLTQVAGRAGRAGLPGRVVIQTYSPGHYALRHALHHDYEAFYAEELRQRAALGYPPFGRLVHAVVSGEDAERTREAADALARRTALPEGVRLLGPAPCPLAKLRGRHRYQLLLKGARPEAMHDAGVALRRACAELPREIHASVDACPLNMM